MFKLNFINKIFVIMVVSVCNTICWADPQIWSSNSKSNAGTAATYQINSSGALTRTSDETRLILYVTNDCSAIEELDNFTVSGTETFNAGTTKTADSNSIYNIIQSQHINVNDILSMEIIPQQNGTAIFTEDNTCFVLNCHSVIGQCTSPTVATVSLAQPAF